MLTDSGARQSLRFGFYILHKGKKTLKTCVWFLPVDPVLRNWGKMLLLIHQEEVKRRGYFIPGIYAGNVEFENTCMRIFICR